MKRKEAIVLTALKMFNESGIHNVGVREIARTMSISVGNLSYHFPKKEDIVAQILMLLLARNNKQFEAFFAAPPTVYSYLELMAGIFGNQYDFRGVAISPLDIKHIYQQHFDYNAIEEKRKQRQREIFNSLNEAGELKLNEKGIEFFVSYITKKIEIEEVDSYFPGFGYRKLF